MKTKLLKPLLAIVCLLCSIGVYAHDFEVDGIYYKKNNETIEVTYRGSSYGSYNNEYTGSIVIPEKVTYNNVTYSVTSIGSSAFEGCTGLIEVTIPNSVTSIGKEAFEDCTGLTQVTIGNSVTSIGYDAFKYCKGLKEVTIPNSVTSIGKEAFRDCTGLTQVTIGNSVTSIGESAFYYCKGLKELTIPNSVTSIGNTVFHYCTGLKSLTIEDGDSELKLGYNGSNEGLFYDCPIETLYLGRNLSYYDSPFENIEELKTVTIGNSVTSIGDYAFYKCSGLTEVTIPNSVTSIGDYAFYNCTGLTEITIPNSVTSIGEYAFVYCTGLTEITIPNSVTSIGEYAFCDCDGLTEITIPNSVTSIGSSAFSYCTGLTTVNFNAENCTYMESSPFPVFGGCDNLKTLNIGESVKTIPDYAFRICYGLTSVTIGNSVTSIGSDAFYGCNIAKTIWLTNTPPKGYKNVSSKIHYVANEQYTGLSNVKVYPYISSLFEVAGVKYVPVSPSERTCDAIDCCYDSTATNIQIDSIVLYKGVAMTVKEVMPYTLYENDFIKSFSINYSGNIGDYLCCDCENLSGIVIPNSITSIGKSAFEGCKKLPEITIPANVTSIGNYAFDGCTSLSDVVIEDRTTALSLGSNGSNGLFASCPLDSVYIGGKITYNTSSSNGYSPFYRNTSLRTVVITDTETEIYDNEFYGCSNLTKVTIGDGVKKIGNWAFSGCSSLDHFVFGTNVESIGQEAFSDCTNVTNIRSYSAVPPVCGTQALDDINKWNCTLSVLENCQSAYQTAEQWKEFFFINAMDKDGKVATPVIVVDSVVVTISCETAKTTIYYTTDGSEPTVESALYTGPFVVDKNCTIKAIAVRTNYYNSDISTAQVDYFVYAESIAIDYETVRIRLNESVTLTATVLPETTTEKGIVWTSSDENIATVENGIVTAHTIGEATITATTTDGTNLSATCKVTVLPILADTITLDQTAVTFKATESATLTATVLPETTTDKGVVWTSSNNEVASVENGVVTAHKVGTAIITATTTDGSNLTATCEVTVEATLATSITLDQSAMTLKATETATLTATVLPETTTVKEVVWTSSDSEVASVENGVVTAHKVGTATITATTTDGSNLTATCEVTVEATLATSITLDQINITAIEGETVVLTATIYPDDATEKAVVWSVSDATIATIEPLNNVSAKVTVLREGVATITAETIDGSNLSATCTIDVYSDIEALLRDSENVEYYDLNGFRVENPTRGIYILKQGNTVKKVVL